MVVATLQIGMEEGITVTPPRQGGRPSSGTAVGRRTLTRPDARGDHTCRLMTLRGDVAAAGADGEVACRSVCMIRCEVGSMN